MLRPDRLRFAWDWGRAATLVVGPTVAGQVAIYYAGDLLVSFDKAAGTTIERAVYPGRAEVVVRAPGAGEEVRQAIVLPLGERMLLEPAPTTRPLVPFGFGIHRLTPKGHDTDATWALAIERPTTTLY